LLLAVALLAAPRAGTAERPSYDAKQWRLLIPQFEWDGITFGLGTDPAADRIVARRGNLGVTVRVLAYDAATDTLKVSIEAERTRPAGVAVSFEAALKQWEPATFSNGSCVGYVLWHREKDVKPEGYAALQIRGVCP
jgi:hypothetical protein